MAKKTIVLTPEPHGRFGEGKAATTLKPGYLANYNSSGNLIPHGTANGHAVRRVVTEDALQGKNSSTDSYASGDQTPFYTAISGDELVMWLKASGSAVTAIGTLLCSNGDGLLRIYTAPSAASDHPIALFQAKEALDLSGGGAVDTQLIVEAL